MSEKLEITAGDDTDFLDKKQVWLLDSERDYTGWKARFTVGVITKDAPIEKEPETGQTFVRLVLNSAETACLEPGDYQAALKLWDSQGRCETVSLQPEIVVLPLEVHNG